MFEKSVKKPGQPIRFEPRWPAIIEVLFVLTLLLLLRTRVSLLPSWFPYALGGAFILPMIGVWLSKAAPLWLRIEFMTIIAISVVAELITILTIGYLIREMLFYPAELTGLELLSSSIGGWVINIMVFSLVYWQIDRGGPENRLKYGGVKPDWHFPQTDAFEKSYPDWQPRYIDYLFLSFSTATAFSAADILPMTSRAKLLMMLESSVSLITLAIVASRAINVLGG